MNPKGNVNETHMPGRRGTQKDYGPSLNKPKFRDAKSHRDNVKGQGRRCHHKVKVKNGTKKKKIMGLMEALKKKAIPVEVGDTEARMLQANLKGQ